MKSLPVGARLCLNGCGSGWHFPYTSCGKTSSVRGLSRQDLVSSGGVVLGDEFDDVLVSWDSVSHMGLLETNGRVLVTDDVERVKSHVVGRMRSLLEPVDTGLGVIDPGDIVVSVTLVEVDDVTGSESVWAEVDVPVWSGEHSFDMLSRPPKFLLEGKGRFTDPELAVLYDGASDEDRLWADRFKAEREVFVGSVVPRSDYIKDVTAFNREMPTLWVEDSLHCSGGVIGPGVTSSVDPTRVGDYHEAADSRYDDPQGAAERLVSSLVWIGGHEALETAVNGDGDYWFESHAGITSIVPKTDEDLEELEAKRRMYPENDGFSEVGYHAGTGEFTSGKRIVFDIKFVDGSNNRRFSLKLG